MDAELAALAAASAGRLRVHHTFSRVTEPAAPPAAARSTGGDTFASTGAGRIDDALARAMLPSPSEDDVFILVCGTDGFVGDMAGPIERVYDDAGKKTKVQGPTLGVLGRLGFRPTRSRRGSRSCVFARRAGYFLRVDGVRFGSHPSELGCRWPFAMHEAKRGARGSTTTRFWPLIGIFVGVAPVEPIDRMEARRA